MSSETLDRLIASQEALLRALDGEEAEQIDQALAGFTAALDAVRSIGGWRDTPDVAARLAHALQLADAARARVNYLADATRRRLDHLAVLGAPTPHRLAYGRKGRAQG